MIPLTQGLLSTLIIRIKSFCLVFGSITDFTGTSITEISFHPDFQTGPTDEKKWYYKNWYNRNSGNPASCLDTQHAWCFVKIWDREVFTVPSLLFKTVKPKLPFQYKDLGLV
jgi:hypothetical protein